MLRIVSTRLNIATTFPFVPKMFKAFETPPLFYSRMRGAFTFSMLCACYDHVATASSLLYQFILSFCLSPAHHCPDGLQVERGSSYHIA